MLTPPGRPWHMAAIFPSRDAAQTVWRQIRNELASMGSVPLSNGVMQQVATGNWILASVSVSEPAPAVMAILERLYAQGSPTTLPDQTVHDLRRARKNQIIGDDEPGEEDTLVPLSTIGAIIAISDEEARTELRRLQANGYPFLECYGHLLHYSAGTDAVMRSSSSGVGDVGLVKATREALRQSMRHIFSDSAQRMLTSVTDYAMDFVAPPYNIWLEFEPEILYRLQDQTRVPVRALHLFRLANEEWLLHIIRDDTATHLLSILCTPNTDLEHTYTTTIDYECPYGHCNDHDVVIQGQRGMVREPCEMCLIDAGLWAAFAHTAVEIIQLKYALTSDPVPFPDVERQYTTLDRVAREGRGNGNKVRTKATIHTVPYTLVSFEVSERERREVDIEVAEESQGRGEPRASWLTMHESAEIIYVWQTIKPFSRHWPRRRDGTRLSDETYTVTLAAGGRYAPMLRADVNQNTVRRVVARRYQNEEQSS